MFLTSIILTAAALYLLTYGGRTSTEETVVARDAMTEHYVTPYYKIESISDDRGVPTADLNSVAQEIRIPDSWRQTIVDRYQMYHDEGYEPERAVTLVDDAAGGGRPAEKIRNVNDYVHAENNSLKDHGFNAYAWAKENDVRVTWEDGA